MPLITASKRVLVRLRFLILALWAVPWTFDMFPRLILASDWWRFEYGARELSGQLAHFTPIDGGALHIYTWIPSLQVGPPALLAAVPFQFLNAWVGRIAAAVLMLLVGLGVLVLLERIAALKGLEAERTRSLTLLGGAFFIPAWCVLSVFYMHLDDVIVLSLAVVAMHEALRGRWWWASLALGVAAATKPWAIAFIPILLLIPRRRRSQAMLTTIGAAAVWWAPFLIAAPGTLQASGSYGSATAKDSTLNLIGQSQSYGVERLGQMFLMVLVGWLVVRSGRWPALMAAVVAVRMITDPQTWLYYAVGLVLGALIGDVLTARSRWPRMTIAATGLLLLESRISEQVGGPPHGGQHFLAAVRAALLLALVVYLVWPAHSAVGPTPIDGPEAADRLAAPDAEGAQPLSSSAAPTR